MRLPTPLVFIVLLPYALAALVWKTHDISSLLVEEKKGVVYKDASGQVQQLEQIVKKGGANSIKIRIWVDPPNGEYNLDYGLKLGKRAKAAGLAVVINFHYSDTWVSSDCLIIFAGSYLLAFLLTDYCRRIQATKSNRRNGRD
jgi:arabinogalactan endo-1,4-beta-galactosidase